MKLTSKKLKQIIREEMKKLSEAPWEPPHAASAKYGESPTSLGQSLKQRSGRPNPLAAPSSEDPWEGIDHQSLLNGKHYRDQHGRV